MPFKKLDIIFPFMFMLLTMSQFLNSHLLTHTTTCQDLQPYFADNRMCTCPFTRQVTRKDSILAYGKIHCTRGGGQRYFALFWPSQRALCVLHTKRMHVPGNCQGPSPKPFHLAPADYACVQTKRLFLRLDVACQTTRKHTPHDRKYLFNWGASPR